MSHFFMYFGTSLILRVDTSTRIDDDTPDRIYRPVCNVNIKNALPINVFRYQHWILYYAFGNLSMTIFIYFGIGTNRRGCAICKSVDVRFAKQWAGEPREGGGAVAV